MLTLKIVFSKNSISQFQPNHVFSQRKFPRPSTILLRENGFIVSSVQEDNPGISDEEVIAIALKLNLIILTFDSDYGELIFRYATNNPPSVVFFREKGQVPEFAGLSLISLLGNSEISLSESFTVIEVNNIRQRFYKK